MKNRIDPGLLGSLKENIERLIVSKKLSTMQYQEQNTGLGFRLPPEIAADRGVFPPATEIRDLYNETF